MLKLVRLHTNYLVIFKEDEFILENVVLRGRLSSLEPLGFRPRLHVRSYGALMSEVKKLQISIGVLIKWAAWFRALV